MFGRKGGSLSDMTEPAGDLEARVAALETRVDGLAGQLQQARQDAVAARVLAGGADRDVEQVREELRDFRRAAVASLNAMRQDVVDLGVRVDDGFARVDDGFSEVQRRLDTTATGLTHITELLTAGLAGQHDDDGR